MRNGDSHHTLDTIVELLRRQNATLEVLMRHLAHAEATLAALTTQSLKGSKKLDIAKALKDQLKDEIYDQMIAEAEENLKQKPDEKA